MANLRMSLQEIANLSSARKLSHVFSFILKTIVVCDVIFTVMVTLSADLAVFAKVCAFLKTCHK